MAISRVDAVLLATATQAGWACALPAGVQDGDVLFAFVAKGASAAPTPPAGKTYTLLDPADAGSTTIYLWCYAHVLAAADAGTTHTWAWGSVRSGAVALLLRGAEAALDQADPPVASTLNTNNLNTPAATVTTPGAWVLRATASTTDTTHAFATPINGNALTREAGAAAGAAGLAWAVYPSAGAAAVCQVTFGAVNRVLGKTLVVKPAAAPSGPATQRWTGSAWTPAAVQRWTGSAWTAATVRRWNGTAWV